MPAAAARGSTEGALDGVLVLALEQAVAIPYCTAKLADAGARVIKIERAEGDFARHYDELAQGQCSYFVWLNRGKQSLVADIKNPHDVALIHRVAARADVFVQNLAPGAAARAGCGSAALRAANPELITLDLTGYGEDGPYADMKAYDLLVQAESGLAAISGGADAPGRCGVSICDLTAGANAYAAIMEALIRRDRTGEPSAIALSLFDGLADMMTPPILQTLAGKEPARIGFSHTAIAPYGAYLAAGGERIVIAVQNQREWTAFCERVLERPELAGDARFATNVARCANRGELDAVIGAAFGRSERGDLAEKLKAANIAFGALNSVADLIDHPQLRRLPVATANGTVEVAAPAHRIADRPHALGAVPDIGEHSDAIRAEFAPAPDAAP